MLTITAAALPRWVMKIGSRDDRPRDHLHFCLQIGNRYDFGAFGIGCTSYNINSVYRLFHSFYR